MKNLFTFISVFFVAFLVILSSCNKDEQLDNSGDNSNNNNNNNTDSTETLYNTGSVSSAVISNKVYNDAVNLVLVKGDEETAKSLNTCPEVSTDPLVGYPKTLTIDFGTGCTYNNTTVSGKIIAVLSDRIRLAGTTVSISFENYTIDTLSVDGTIALTIDDYSLQSGIFTVSDEITGATIVTPTQTLTFAANQTITWDTQGSYSDPLDDKFMFYNGNASGTGSDGSFTTQILDTLLYEMSCTEMVSGKWKVETSNVPYPSTIDFGYGTCDGVATVMTTIEIEYGGQTFTRDYTYDISLF